MKPHKDSVSSRMRPLAAALFVLGLLGLVGGFALTSSEAGDVVLIDQPVSEDLYAAGSSVDVRADVNGDVTVAGETVSASGVVTGDVLAAAQSLSLSGDFRDDIRVAGRSVTLTGHVHDHAIAAGETVVLADSSRISGFTWVAGNELRLAGEIGGDLVAAGQTVTLTGTVDGDAQIDGATTVIGENAHIRGDLVWHQGNEPQIRPGAQIDGRRIERPGEGPMVEEEDTVVAIIAGIVFGALSLLLLTWVLRAGVPPVMQGAATLLRQRPGRSLGFGLLALIVAPIVAIIALVTVIGAPIGLVIMLGYAVLLVISVPVVVEAVADAVVARRRTAVVERPSTWPWVGFVALASLVFVAAMQIPFVGWLLGLVVIVMGLGALVMRAFRRQPKGTITTQTVTAPVAPGSTTPGPTAPSGS